MNSGASMGKSIKGLTIVELLAVVSIVAILAVVAIPSYTGYLERARRADAKTALEQVRAAQEMWRAERGTYAIDDGNGTALAKLQNTMGAPSTTVSRYYTWNFTSKTATAFTAQATPTGSQTSDRGGSLFIDQNGTKWSVKDGNTLDSSNPLCAWTK